MSPPGKQARDVPAVRVVTLDHPSSLWRSRLVGRGARVKRGIQWGLGIIVGFWPLVAVVALVGGLIWSAAMGHSP